MRRNAFGRFLLDNAISLRAAARALDVSHVAVREWARGRRPEDEAMRIKIATWTAGKVPASSWAAAKDQARVARAREIQPYTPPAVAGVGA